MEFSVDSLFKTPEILESLGEKEKSDLCRILIQAKDGYEKSIEGDKDAVMKYLEDLFVKRETGKLGNLSWTIIHVKFPSKWEFAWGSLDFFESHSSNINPILLNSYTDMYSEEDILAMFKSVNNFMEEFNLSNDKDFDYGRDLKYWKGGKNNNITEAWNFLKAITGLNKSYLLKDGVVFDCSGNNCCFRKIWDGYFPLGKLAPVK